HVPSRHVPEDPNDPGLESGDAPQVRHLLTLEASPLRVKRHTPEATLPQRATEGSAGYDLCSAISTTLDATGRALIPLELSIEVPLGHYGRVAPRSGLAMKHGINVGAGVIDSDYRGKVAVVLFNHTMTPFEIKVGDRIAQLILERCSTPMVEEIQEHTPTERGEGGFGSTGMAALSPSTLA
ncbi:MAG: dUTP diphosphatase, partial [Actinomycetales bacterium]